MSALPTKADMVQRGRDVRFVPLAEVLEEAAHIPSFLGADARLPALAVGLNDTSSQIFRGPLPRPAALNFCFQRKTEKGANAHYCSQQPNAIKRKRSGNGGDNVCANEQFKSEQNATSNIGTITRISRSPVRCARTIAEKPHRR